MNKKILLSIFCCVSLGLLTQVKGMENPESDIWAPDGHKISVGETKQLQEYSFSETKEEQEYRDYREQFKENMFEDKVRILVDLFETNPAMFKRLMGFLNSAVSEGYGAQSEQVKELKKEISKQINKKLSLLMK